MINVHLEEGTQAQIEAARRLEQEKMARRRFAEVAQKDTRDMAEMTAASASLKVIEHKFLDVKARSVGIH